MFGNLPIELLVMVIQENHETTETLALVPGYLPEFKGKMHQTQDLKEFS